MNNHFDIAYLRKYVNGELSPSEMYAIEKASHQDELLMDLILGLEAEKELGSELDQKDLDSAIYERTHPQKVINFNKYRWLSIAATLILAFGIGMIWYMNREQSTLKYEDSIAHTEMASPADTTVNVAPIDSIIDEPIEEQRIAFHNPNAKNKRTSDEAVVEIQRPTLTLPSVPSGSQVSADSFGAKRAKEEKADNNYIAQNKMQDYYSENMALNESTIVLRGNTDRKRNVIVGSAPLSSAQDKKTIATGRVLDQNSGRPLAHVTVRDIKTNEVTVTDSSGQYIMPLSSKNQELEILSLGYETKRIIASNNKIVQLQPEMSMVEEVTVVGYGGKSSRFKSEPLAGWTAYKKYLKDQTAQSLAGKGTVTLVFDISSFGRPFDFKVKNSSNPELNQKAIQIIQNGPDWQLGNDGKKVEIKVEFEG